MINKIKVFVSTKSEVKDFLVYTLIVLITNSSTLILATAKNTIIAKNFNPDYLNAYVITSSVITLMSYTLLFYNSGLVALLTMEVTQKEYSMIGKRINASLIMGVVVSSLFVVLLYFTRDFFLLLYNPPPHVKAIIDPFYNIYLCIIPFIIIGLINGSIFIGLGALFFRMCVELIGIILDIVFTLVFINLLSFGFNSIVYSFFLSRSVTETIHLLYIYQPRHIKQFGLFRKEGWNFREPAFRSKFAVDSGFLVGRGVVLLAQYIIAPILVSRLGQEELTCYTIMNNLWLYPALISDSIGSTVSIKGSEYVALSFHSFLKNMKRALPLISLGVSTVFTIIYGLSYQVLFPALINNPPPIYMKILNASVPYWLAAVFLAAFPGPYEGLALAHQEFPLLFIVMVVSLSGWGVVMLINVWGWDFGAQKGWWMEQPKWDGKIGMFGVPLVYGAVMVFMWVRFFPFAIMYTCVPLWKRLTGKGKGKGGGNEQEEVPDENDSYIN